jgi:HEPN domain-containing protein
MTRSELQQLAQDRLDDAQALLAAQRWTAAYYLAGYAVECGLKSCIITYLSANLDVIFKQRDFSRNCWTHDLN